MKEQNGVKFLSKSITVIFSILATLVVFGKWLIPPNADIFEVSEEYGYSLFEISDFLDNINRYVKYSEIEFLSLFFSILAPITIIFFIITIIFGLIDTDSNPFANAAASAGIILAVVFLFVVYYINSEVRNDFYTDMPDVLKASLKPYLLIIFSIIVKLGAGVNKKTSSYKCSSTNIININYCTACGSEIPYRATFCPGCGERVSVLKPATLANETSFKGNSRLDKSYADSMLKNGGWKCCKCGKVNPSYTGTCGCGYSKHINN